MAIAILVMVVCALAACGGPNAPNATTLLKNAQTKFNSTKTLHFVMTVEHAGKPPTGGYSVTSATGDVERPDKVSASAVVDAGFASTTINLVIIGSNEWYTNPLTGNFEQTTQFSSFLTVFDPQNGIGGLLTALKNPSQPQDGSANGQACWKVSGQLSQQDLKPLFGTNVIGEPKQTTFCIGKSDNQVYSIAFTGQMLTGDTSATVRTFYLSKFDQPVSIQSPLD
jgi:lipoprotein LprG